MKRTAVLLCAVVLVILVSCSVSSTLNHQLAREQYGAISTDAGETSSSPLLGEAEHSVEIASSAKTEDGATKDDPASSGEILSDAMDVSKACESKLQDDKDENALNSDIPPTEAPIPDGRIFHRGEPPYGYLPTCYPKQNISFPIIPLELDT
jgi:hypothetical protein